MKLPTSIELKKKSRLLAIEYGSDRYELPFEFLRVFSPSAEVQGHTPTRQSSRSANVMSMSWKFFLSDPMPCKLNSATDTTAEFTPMTTWKN